MIRGNDGPTSIFIVGKGKKTVKQRVHKFLYKIRKAWIEKHLKPDPHNMDEVMNYIKNQYGFMEVDHSSDEYQNQYKEMRASFIMMYAPELLGEYAARPKLFSRDEEGIQKFMEQLAVRKEVAEEVPSQVFDIDFHIFKNEQADVHMEFLIESKHGYIGGSFSGPGKREKKQYEKMYHDVYRYYGVSVEDIANKTKRYEDVVRGMISF